MKFFEIIFLSLSFHPTKEQNMLFRRMRRECSAADLMKQEAVTFENRASYLISLRELKINKISEIYIFHWLRV
jgi:hypothetical protein